MEVSSIYLSLNLYIYFPGLWVRRGVIIVGLRLRRVGVAAAQAHAPAAHVLSPSQLTQAQTQQEYH